MYIYIYIGNNKRERIDGRHDNSCAARWGGGVHAAIPARCNSSAMERHNLSCPTAAITWKPTGRPLASRPAGTCVAGKPIRLKSIVYMTPVVCVIIPQRGKAAVGKVG